MTDASSKRARTDGGVEHPVFLQFPHGTLAPKGFETWVSHGDLAAVQHELDGLVRNLASRDSDIRRAAGTLRNAEWQTMYDQLQRTHELQGQQLEEEQRVRREAQALHQRELAQLKADLQTAREQHEAAALADAQRAVDAQLQDLHLALQRREAAEAVLRDQVAQLQTQLRVQASDVTPQMQEVIRVYEQRCEDTALQLQHLREQYKAELEAVRAQQEAASPFTQELITALRAQLAQEREARDAMTDAHTAQLAEARQQLDAALARIPVARTNTGLSTVQLGKEGEDIARGLLRHVFNGGAADTPAFLMRDVSGETKQALECGDIELVINGTKARCEVKNYSKAVPTPVIDRFRAEMAAMHDVGAGIFLALNSGVVGVHGDYAVEILPTGVKLHIMCNLLHGDDREREMRLQHLKAAVLADMAAWREAHENDGAQDDGFTWRNIALNTAQAALTGLQARRDELAAHIRGKCAEVNTLKAQLKVLKKQCNDFQAHVGDLRAGRTTAAPTADANEETGVDTTGAPGDAEGERRKAWTRPVATPWTAEETQSMLEFVDAHPTMKVLTALKAWLATQPGTTRTVVGAQQRFHRLRSEGREATV